MSKTACRAVLKLDDTTAILDANVSTDDEHSIGTLQPFKEDSAIEVPAYGTLEQNQFVLNGQRPIMPSDVSNIAFWSHQKSGWNCAFENVPTIMVTFSKNHTSAGITLYFADDYPSEVSITWFDLNERQIEKQTFYPDSLTYFCKKQVQNYGAVKIAFTKTRLPGRYVKLQYVQYGTTITWSDDIIMSASVHEEVDETSDTLAINTADITIYDEAYEFDIENMNGLWKSIQSGQPVDIIETKDGVDISIGTLYVDEQSFSDCKARFSFVDVLGLMDKVPFREGQIYDGITAGSLMEQIFAVAGISRYEISDDVYDIPLTGYLEIQTCREALQQVCFACGAMADTSRSDMVKIFQPTRYVSSHVGTNRKISGQTSYRLEEYVSGVSIQCTTYTPKTEMEKLYEGTLPEGLNTIDLNSPCIPESVTITGGSLIEVKTNYIKVQMSETGSCVINGIGYSTGNFTVSREVENNDGGESGNVKEYSSITLYNEEALAAKLEALLNYFSLRKQLSMQYFVGSEKVGDWITIGDIKRNTAATLLVSQDIDLSGGYIATAECRGYSKVITALYYTGMELYAGGNAII